jgi:hypothetical protein
MIGVVVIMTKVLLSYANIKIEWKPLKLVLKGSGEEIWNSNREYKFDQSMLYACMEIPQ